MVGTPPRVRAVLDIDALDAAVVDLFALTSGRALVCPADACDAFKSA